MLSSFLPQTFKQALSYAWNLLILSFLKTGFLLFEISPSQRKILWQPCAQPLSLPIISLTALCIIHNDCILYLVVWCLNPQVYFTLTRAGQNYVPNKKHLVDHCILVPGNCIHNEKNEWVCFRTCQVWQGAACRWIYSLGCREGGSIKVRCIQLQNPSKHSVLAHWEIYVNTFPLFFFFFFYPCDGLRRWVGNFFSSRKDKTNLIKLSHCVRNPVIDQLD